MDSSKRYFRNVVMINISTDFKLGIMIPETVRYNVQRVPFQPVDFNPSGV